MLFTELRAVCSHRVLVAGGKLSFSNSRSNGAILVAPDVIYSHEALSKQTYKRYLYQCIDSWYALTRRLGLSLRMEDIILVTGCDLTKSWANAIIFEHSVEGGLDLEVTFAPAGGAKVTTDIRWTTTQSALVNTGPINAGMRQRLAYLQDNDISTTVLQDPDSSMEALNTKNDQCLFIRGFQAKRRRFLISRILGARGSTRGIYEDDSSGDDLGQSGRKVTK